MSVVSASALTSPCGYVRKLKREAPPNTKRDAAAARGTKFHEAIARWIRDGVPPVVEDLEMQGWIDLLAAQWSPRRTETFHEVAWGLSPDGAHVHVTEPRPHEYEAMNGSPLLTAGRADVCYWTTEQPEGTDGRGCGLMVIDWKTGAWPVTPAGDNLQVNAAGMALARRHGLAWYMPGIYYVRDGYFDWGDPVILGSADHQRAWEAVREAAQLDETPRPGEHCAGCWERSRCSSAP